MEHMFGPMEHGFFDGASVEDKQKFDSCFEKMAAFYPCCNMKDLDEADKKALIEKLNTFCSNRMGQRI